MTKSDLKERRKNISRLIYMILAENLTVKEAIMKFPKGTDDPTLRTVYHALIHLEADEELRQKDIEYKEEQNDYLEFLAEILQEGKALPQNIITSYDKYYKNIEIPRSENMKGLIKSLCRFLNV